MYPQPVAVGRRHECRVDIEVVGRDADRVACDFFQPALNFPSEGSRLDIAAALDDVLGDALGEVGKRQDVMSTLRNLQNYLNSNVPGASREEHYKEIIDNVNDTIANILQ